MRKHNSSFAYSYIPSLISAAMLVRETLINESINKYLSDQFEEQTVLKKNFLIKRIIH